jgi:hypothetical protein
MEPEKMFQKFQLKLQSNTDAQFTVAPPFQATLPLTNATTISAESSSSSQSTESSRDAAQRHLFPRFQYGRE